MKKLLVAMLLASVSGHLFAQAPAAENAPAQAQPAAVTAAPQAPAIETAAPAQAQPAAPVIKVEKIVTAAGIEKKEPVNESSVFDKDTAKVYTWTRIVSETVPTKVKHVYYLNEKKAGEIEIQINGSPWRIWSAKNVRPGSWKVDVTGDDDKVLASVVFTVSDAAKAETPSGFEISFQKTAEKITMQAAGGTDWKEAEFACKTLPCRFYVNRSGVGSEEAKAQQDSAFAFLVEMTEKGADLKAIRGTGWTDLQYSCAADPCKFVVDAKGVNTAN